MILTPKDFNKVQQGDVLVARITTTTYNVRFPESAYMGLLSVLLQWHQADPPDAGEIHIMGREFARGDRSRLYEVGALVGRLAPNVKSLRDCGIATGRQPDLLAPFALSRFERFALVGEKGAAAVGH